MKIFSAILFFTATLIELSAHLFGSGLNAYSKPLLMPLLLVYFLSSYDFRIDRDSLLLSLAILLSCAGDIFLMGQGTTHFIAGLSFFLFAHITYVFIFIRSKSTGDFVFRFNWKLILPMMVYVVGLLFFLLPGSGPMATPIIIYGLVILLMWYTSILRFGIQSPYQNWQIIIGATLFVISDTMIGLNRFYTEIPQNGLLIMSTYIAAQFLITNGLLGYFNSSTRIADHKIQSI